MLSSLCSHQSAQSIYSHHQPLRQGLRAPAQLSTPRCRPAAVAPCRGVRRVGHAASSTSGSADSSDDTVSSCTPKPAAGKQQQQQPHAGRNGPHRSGSGSSDTSVGGSSNGRSSSLAGVGSSGKQHQRNQAAAAAAGAAVAAGGGGSCGINAGSKQGPNSASEDQPGSTPQQQGGLAKAGAAAASAAAAAAASAGRPPQGSRQSGAGAADRDSNSKKLARQQSMKRTEAIQATLDPQQLLDHLQQHAANLDHINVSAAFTWAVKLWRTPQQQREVRQQLLSELHQLADRLQHQCEARGLANIIWSAARLRAADTAALLLPSFLQPSSLQQAKSQEVASVLWAAATLQLSLPEEQVQRLLQRMVELLPHTKPQAVSNTVWAVATLGQQVPQQQLSAMLQRFMQLLPDANPQDVSNTVWAVATLGQQVPQQHLSAMLQRMMQLLPKAKPQEVSNTPWAVATMGQQVPQQQLSGMLQRFMQLLPKAKPQEVSNTLWAVATMGQQVPQQHLSAMLQRFVEELPAAKPQEVSNTLLACAHMRHAPLHLLSALQHQPQQLRSLLAGANPQGLANMAWACGQLGYKLLPGLLLQQAVQLLQVQKGADRFTMQGVCNLCWAAAVLDLQQCVPQVLQLAAACNRLWQTAADEGLRQLHQAQLWLLDSQLPAPGQGLLGVLTQQQLGQCKVAWEQQRKESAAKQASDLQQAVFAAAKQLPAGTWQQQPALEQPTPDGAYSIDIAGVTAAGVRVAVEVDGPWHFVQPGNTLDGTTQCRNRALAVRGYSVVSIPYWEWDNLRGQEQQQQAYLLAKLQSAAAGGLQAGVAVAATAKAGRSGSSAEQQALSAAATLSAAAAEVLAAAEGSTGGQRDSPPVRRRRRRLSS